MFKKNTACKIDLKLICTFSTVLTMQANYDDSGASLTMYSTALDSLEKRKFLEKFHM